jgi:hypothetical protein
MSFKYLVATPLQLRFSNYFSKRGFLCIYNWRLRWGLLFNIDFQLQISISIFKPTFQTHFSKTQLGNSSDVDFHVSTTGDSTGEILFLK